MIIDLTVLIEQIVEQEPLKPHFLMAVPMTIYQVLLKVKLKLQVSAEKLPGLLIIMNQQKQEERLTA